MITIKKLPGAERLPLQRWKGMVGSPLTRKQVFVYDACANE